MRGIVLSGLVLGLAAAGLAGWVRFGGAHSREGSRGGTLTRVSRRDIATWVKATGIIKPKIGAEVNVGSSVSGVVMRLHVQIGDRVGKGQLLAELDDRALKARSDADAAALRVADAELDYAGVDLERKRRLHQAAIIAQSELDVAEKSYAVAKQQRDQAAATLADAATELGYSRIFAPIAGVVSSVSTQEGETVAASFAAPTFVTLLDLTRLEVWAYVDETDIGRIRTGQNARFTVDTYGDREFTGTVTAIHPKAEIRDNVVDYVVVIGFHAPSGFTLRPEMTTMVTIAEDRHTGVLVLPARAVRREGGETFVLCPNGSKVERRPVKTGIRDDSDWEILAGLGEGDAVLEGEVNTQ